MKLCLKHNIPLGQVVELSFPEHHIAAHYTDNIGKEIDLGFKGSVKLIVVGHHYGFDNSQQYYLSTSPIKIGLDCSLIGPDLSNHPGEWTIQEVWEYKKWVEFSTSGWKESSLKVVAGEFIEIKYNSIWDFLLAKKIHRSTDQGSLSNAY